MTNLKQLDWNVPKEYTNVIGEVFEKRKLVLPSVKILVVAAGSHYLVPMCPNLEILENSSIYYWPEDLVGNDWKKLLIQAAVSSPILKRFAMGKGWWLDGWSVSLVSGKFTPSKNVMQHLISRRTGQINAPT